MKRSKVDEVAIVISREDEVLMKKILNDGFNYGLKIEYFIQEEPNGTYHTTVLGTLIASNLLSFK